MYLGAIRRYINTLPFLTFPFLSPSAIIRDPRYENSGVDLGFYKSGCPIHLKGAPEGAKPPNMRAEGDVGVFPENLKI